jgi:hypothetical protein
MSGAALGGAADGRQGRLGEPAGFHELEVALELAGEVLA